MVNWLNCNLVDYSMWELKHKPRLYLFTLCQGFWFITLLFFYCPQWSCGKVVFTGVCDSVHGRCAWLGGVHAQGHGGGHACPGGAHAQGVCMPKGCVPRGCACLGGVHAQGLWWGHAWLGDTCGGGMHGRGCMHGWGMHAQGCAWWGWACMPGEGGLHAQGACQGGCMAGMMATAVASMHPTGMHSCSIILWQIGQGVCMPRGNGGGHAWGMCMPRGCGGGMHGWEARVVEACVVGHAWQGVHACPGVCMVGVGMYAWGGDAWQERRPLQWLVRILLECILVLLCFDRFDGIGFSLLCGLKENRPNKTGAFKSHPPPPHTKLNWDWCPLPVREILDLSRGKRSQLT